MIFDVKDKGLKFNSLAHYIRPPTPPVGFSSVYKIHEIMQETTASAKIISTVFDSECSCGDECAEPRSFAADGIETDGLGGRSLYRAQEGGEGEEGVTER